MCEKRETIKKMKENDILIVIQYKIDNLMWGVLKSEYRKQKKQVLILKETKFFVLANVNVLIMYIYTVTITIM